MAAPKLAAPLLCVVSAANLGAAAPISPPEPTPFVALGSPLVQMPALNLGTCCGSDPRVGLPTWLEMGGTGIDTAYDYHDQSNISDVLRNLPPAKSRGNTRGDLFILSKISPDGYSTLAGKASIRGSDALCKLGAAGALGQLKEDLKELNTTYVDIVLLHWPCGKHTGTDLEPEKLAQNSELWAGLMEAKAMGLTRAIGVSSYNQTHLEALKGEKPVLNQCSMSLKKHDDATIEYCLRNNITYEAFGVMRGCPFTDPKVTAIAEAHKVSTAQVCVRWTLQRGAIAALGTGSDPTKVKEYTEENLGVWNFKLSTAEMATLNGLQDELHE